MAIGGNNTISLVESEVNKYMLDIIDCSNKVKAIFNKVDDLVTKLKGNYACESANTLYKQYEEFNDN